MTGPVSGICAVAVSALVPDDLVPAPDFSGALEAWRVWRVVPGDGGERVLRSGIKSTLWPRRIALCAECLCPRGPLAWIRRKHQHDARCRDAPRALADRQPTDDA